MPCLPHLIPIPLASSRAWHYLNCLLFTVWGQGSTPNMAPWKKVQGECSYLDYLLMLARGGSHMQDMVEPLCSHGQGCLGSPVPQPCEPIAQERVGGQSWVLAHTSPAEGLLKLEWSPTHFIPVGSTLPTRGSPQEAAMREAEAQP